MNHCWVENGQVRGIIALSRTAGLQEKFAACELNSYIKQISGTELPVVSGMADLSEPAIKILNSSRPSNRKFLSEVQPQRLKYDGYIIKSSGKDMIIASNEPSGIVFAVYKYLAGVLGVCFNAPGPLGEDITPARTIEHGEVDILQNPRLWYRCLQYIHDSDGIDWMAKNGFNYVRYGGSFDWWEENGPLLREHIDKRGIKIAFGHHIFHHIIEEKTYVEDNPEFFPKVDGVNKAQPQFSWSLKNTDVLEEVVYNLTSFLRRHPEIDMLDFWPADGLYEVNEDDYKAVTGEEMDKGDDWKKHIYGAMEERGIITPDSSRLGNPYKAKIYSILTTRIAEALAVKFPDLKICSLHYVDLIQPCPDVKLPENVFPMLAMYWRCVKHKITEPNCLYNGQYLQVIREWTGQYPDNRILLYEYYMGMFAHICLPYPCLTAMFKEWDELKIGGAQSQSFDRHWVPYGINYLAFARIAWENPPTLEQFLMEYCRDFFREGWEPMLKLYRLWEENVQSLEHTQPGFYTIDYIFNEATLKKTHCLISEAQEKCVDPKAVIRIARMRVLIEYTDKVASYLRCWRSYHDEPGDAQKKEEKERDLQERLQDILIYIQRMEETGLDMFHSIQHTPRLLEGLIKKTIVQDVPDGNN